MSFATWQQLIPFGLQRFAGVGGHGALSLVVDSQVCTCIAAPRACKRGSTLAGCPQPCNRQPSWGPGGLLSISARTIQSPHL